MTSSHHHAANGASLGGCSSGSNGLILILFVANCSGLFRPNPTLLLPRSSIFSPSASTVLLFPHTKKECPLQLSVSLLHLFSLLIRAASRLRSRLMFSLWHRVHAGWVAFLRMVCDQWGYHRCAGIQSVQTTGGWTFGAAPHAPPRSHLLRPPARRIPLTWSARFLLSHPGAPSPSRAVLFHRT